MRNVAALLGGILILSAEPTSAATPPAIISLPTKAQLLSAYPLRAKADGVSGSVRLECVVSPGPDPEVISCPILSEPPGGYEFGIWAQRVSIALIRISPENIGEDLRGLPVTIQWTATRPGNNGPLSFDASIKIGSLEHAPPSALRAMFTPRAPIAPPPYRPAPKPVNPRMASAGPCFWEGIGPKGRTEFIEAAGNLRRSELILEYHGDWQAIESSCAGPIEGFHSPEGRAILGYAIREASLARLEIQGLSAGRLDAAMAAAPLSARAAMYEPHVIPWETRPIIWAPVFVRLGLLPLMDWIDSSPQALVVQYLHGQATLAEAIKDRSPDDERIWRDDPWSTDDERRGDDLIFSDPVWAREPTREELARSYPVSALEEGKSATAIMECRPRPDGMLEKCLIVSLLPQASEVSSRDGHYEAYKAAERYYRLDMSALAERLARTPRRPHDRSQGRQSLPVIRFEIRWPFDG